MSNIVPDVPNTVKGAICDIRRIKRKRENKLAQQRNDNELNATSGKSSPFKRHSRRYRSRRRKSKRFRLKFCFCYNHIIICIVYAKQDQLKNKQ